jgi:YesN/AraC family two-component response regulator
MEEAQKLLTDTDDLIYNIAEKVGYHDSRHFSKMFKNVVGSSPGKYRNKERKQRSAIWLSAGY